MINRNYSIIYVGIFFIKNSLQIIMTTNLKIVALIPARSGSKGIINKNIKLYKGIPLLAHSIKSGLSSIYINEVYVSTDCVEYGNISSEYGAKIIIRPSQFSDDLSPDIDTFNHFINELTLNNIEIPDLIIHLRPTYPNRSIELIDKCIKTFIDNYNNYDSLRTVVKFDKTPYKMYTIENDNLIPIIKNYNNIIEPFNQARQIFPDTYLHNGCIDIIKTESLKNNNLLSGNNIFPFIMDENEINDIDNLNDFIKSENK